MVRVLLYLIHTERHDNLELLASSVREPRLELLFLSHCVPNPPDKGEKIRAYHEVRLLSRDHRVHVVCFAKNPQEVAQAREMEEWCASVHVELVAGTRFLARAAAAYCLGESLNFGYYRSPAIHRAVRSLAARVKLDAAVAYSVVMQPFVPAGLPHILDMIDVDSEKWLTFGQSRFPRWFFRGEAMRLRAREISAASGALVTYLATPNERDLFKRIACEASPSPVIHSMENGVDAVYYDPASVAPDPALRGRRYLVFTGAFNSFANVEGAVWFANEVFPELKAKTGHDLQLILAGRDPSPAVRRLAGKPGVSVTGYIPDTRPYLLGALAVVAPLRVARGIQNKVLEGLAMDKDVLVTREVAKTFGSELPAGVVVCGTEPADWVAGLQAIGANPAGSLRAYVKTRYSWERNLSMLIPSTRPVDA